MVHIRNGCFDIRNTMKNQSVRNKTGRNQHTFSLRSYLTKSSFQTNFPLQCLHHILWFVSVHKTKPKFTQNRYIHIRMTEHRVHHITHRWRTESSPLLADAIYILYNQFFPFYFCVWCRIWNQQRAGVQIQQHTKPHITTIKLWMESRQTSRWYYLISRTINVRGLVKWVSRVLIDISGCHR